MKNLHVCDRDEQRGSYAASGVGVVPVGQPTKGTAGSAESVQLCHTHLLVGGDGVGKTSLAFQAAVSMATENQQVMFIRPKELGHLPLPVHGMPSPQSAALQLLKFWYPDQAEDVVKWCGNLHTQTLIPDIIIVDDFDVYSAQSKNAEHGAARLCACLQDAAHWITQTRGQQCQVILTAGHGVGCLPSVCRQFHFTCLHLTGDKEKNGTAHLKCVTPTTSVSLTYVITRQHISLQTADITMPGK